MSSGGFVTGGGFSQSDDAAANISAPGQWAINAANSRLAESSGIHNGGSADSCDGDGRGTKLFVEGYSIQTTSFAVRFGVTIGDNSGAGGVVFNYVDENNYMVSIL
jgi:hypothetical protein